MRTPASIGKHPIHPMLIAFPIGLWIFSLVCDLVYLGGGQANIWATVALYAVNIWLRFNDPANTAAGIVLSVIGVGMLAASSWLGGEMVHVHGVGVEPQSGGSAQGSK